MFFNIENSQHEKLKGHIPANMSYINLNKWIYTISNVELSTINEIMLEIIASKNKKLKYLSDFINKAKIINPIKNILFKDYEIETIDYLIGNIYNLDQTEKMMLIHYMNLINDYNEIGEEQIEENDDEEFEKLLKLPIEEKLEIENLKIVEKESKSSDILFMESLRKTNVIFEEFYKENFLTQLKDHQVRVIRWIIERRYKGIICADTGVGKTLIALSIAEFLFEVGAIDKIIILAPLSSLNVWKMELEKHVSSPNISKYIFINYEKLLSKEILDVENSLCILDEAHRIKNEFSKTCENFKKHIFKYSLALSATIVDKIDELKYVANIMNLENPIDGDMVDCEILKNIMCNISATSIGIKEASEFNLPIELENNLYNRHEKELISKQIIDIALKNKLNEFCSNNNYDKVLTNNPNLGKFNKLISLIELHKKDQIIIFTNYVSTAKMIHEKIYNKYNSRVIYGELNEKIKENTIEDFKTNKFQIIIATQKLLGVSQNLQNSNVIIFWDNLWSMPNKKQAKGRILRIGQEKDCFIYNLFYKKTIEEEILKRVDSKEKDFIKLMKITQI